MADRPEVKIVATGPHSQDVSVTVDGIELNRVVEALRWHVEASGATRLEMVFTGLKHADIVGKLGEESCRKLATLLKAAGIQPYPTD